MFGEDYFSTLQTESDEEIQKKPKPLSPPKDRHEWLQRNGFKQWPAQDKTNESFDKLEPESVLGDLDDIKQDLRDHAGWDNSFLNDVDKRLHVLEEQLLLSSERFMSELFDRRTSGRSGLRMVNIENETNRFRNSEIIKTLKKNDKPGGHKSSISVERGRTVEEAIFPGFPGGAAPLLPGNIDSLSLLDLVTKLLNFYSSFLKFWRKISFSDESVAFIQLFFWWLWMEKYKPDVDQQSELLTKMAETFTELVLKPKGKKRDEFFLKYPNCISQALYSIFCQAFPRSIRQFHCKTFLQWLCSNVYELITGLPSPVECWNEWQMNELDPLYEEVTSNKKPTTPNNRQMLNASVSLSRKTLTFSEQNSILSMSVSAKQQCANEGDRQIAIKDESPQIGPGLVFESAKFGTACCSPLLQHHLWIHGLVDSSQLQETRKHNLMTRTQIKELVPPSMTYSKLMSQVTNLSEQRYEEYTKEVAGYKQEIRKAITNYHTNKRDMQRETKKLLEHRHEISIEAEKIVAVYNSQSVPLKDINKLNVEHQRNN